MRAIAALSVGIGLAGSASNASAQVLLSLPLLFFGAEVGVGRSEGDADATWFRGIELPQQVLVGVTERVRVKPRWNYTATARIGVSPLPGLGVYALAGYGGERVEVTTEPVGPTE